MEIKKNFLDKVTNLKFDLRNYFRNLNIKEGS